MNKFNFSFWKISWIDSGIVLTGISIILGTWIIALLSPTLREGILGVNWWYISIFLLITLHITLTLQTIYLHRSETHRAVKFHPLLTHLFRFWLWLFIGAKRREWVAIHHLHHKYTDTPKDPHSPVINGLFKMLLYGLEVVHEAKKSDSVRTFEIHDYDFLEKNLYEKHAEKGPILLLCLEVLALGIWAVPLWSIQIILVSIITTFYINGMAHTVGYRSYNTNDNSKNICRLGVLGCGEELHNNHHANPASANFSHRKDEFDLGWFYIQKLVALKLASVRKE
ncbi:fatty acid desaturase [Fluoribacter dumoffii]|uniref:acyl-CoA desaturase n=1 Tax=Fluoribacter dumoffii TaxID=463 RepID=UPI00026C772C|nr:fatty acid desaturase [Fluoribacter dumoffii]MCW8386646.1 fatty acid desaturase [Fluoribacter dumoffii]MCW8419700.1 fatty acid desaturase [Fluoribacter dumoffii]MCW8455597.1 fatty acid desaturase [Fluoribacter dumoffii]MCW8460324.1 fatty acid desaturase [Fluoribacter dumoffii]MCW8483803.1 fatty acid desaturase [Fluoribacter dumoffii]